jgi:hypothetical protein
MFVCVSLQDLLDGVERFGKHLSEKYLKSRRSVVFKRGKLGELRLDQPGAEAKEREKLSWSIMVLQCIAGHTSIATTSAVKKFLKWQEEEFIAKVLPVPMPMVVGGEGYNQDQVSQERSDVEY